MPAELLNLHFLKEQFNLPIATIKILYQLALLDKEM